MRQCDSADLHDVIVRALLPDDDVLRAPDPGGVAAAASHADGGADHALAAERFHLGALFVQWRSKHPATYITV